MRRTFTAVAVCLCVMASGCGTEDAADTIPTNTGTATRNTDTSGAATTVESSGGDTGRMSDGEYEWLTRYDDKFLEELQQWTDGYVTCAQIGQTGDLAGFRDCIKDSWDGVEDDGLLAYTNAKETYDDVGKGCLTALQAYARRLDAVYSLNKNAYDVASSLELAAFQAAFKGLPRQAKKFAAADIRVRDACKPT